MRVDVVPREAISVWYSAASDSLRRGNRAPTGKTRTRGMCAVAVLLKRASSNSTLCRWYRAPTGKTIRRGVFRSGVVAGMESNRAVDMMELQGNGNGQIGRAVGSAR